MLELETSNAANLNLLLRGTGRSTQDSRINNAHPRHFVLLKPIMAGLQDGKSVELHWTLTD